MLIPRIIPCLQLRENTLVKTTKFRRFKYIGDPVNTCKIFNELNAHEIVLLDILASKNNIKPNFELISEISDECFMPLSYGGGIKSLNTAERILKLGVEKIVLNTASIISPNFVNELVREFGSQCIIVSVDIKKHWYKGNICMGMSGLIHSDKNPVEWARELQDRGVGELLLTSIDREGTWKGLDIDLISRVSRNVTIPVIANGGARGLEDIKNAFDKGKASAVALGNTVFFQGPNLGVLISMPHDSQDIHQNNYQIIKQDSL